MATQSRTSSFCRFRRAFVFLRNYIGCIEHIGAWVPNRPEAVFDDRLCGIRNAIARAGCQEPPRSAWCGLAMWTPTSIPIPTLKAIFQTQVLGVLVTPRIKQPMPTAIKYHAPAWNNCNGRFTANGLERHDGVPQSDEPHRFNLASTFRAKRWSRK